MAWIERLPDYLLGEAVSDTVLIGPRTVIQVFDPTGTPQSLALSTSIVGTIISGSAASIPAFTTLGKDVQVGPDEALIVERLSVWITARDTSGKLQITNLDLHDNYGSYRLNPPNAQLPYTFSTALNDRLSVVAAIEPRNPLVRTATDFTGSFLQQWGAQYALTNTDGAGAHTYTRQLVVVYRKIQGLAPSVPKLYSR